MIKGDSAPFLRRTLSFLIEKFRADGSAVRTERYRDKGRRQFRRFQEEKGVEGEGKTVGISRTVSRPPYPLRSPAPGGVSRRSNCFPAAFKLGQCKSDFKRQFQRTPTDFRPELWTGVKVRGQQTSSKTRANNQSQPAAAVPCHPRFQQREEQKSPLQSCKGLQISGFLVGQ